MDLVGSGLSQLSASLGFGNFEALSRDRLFNVNNGRGFISVAQGGSKASNDRPDFGSGLFKRKGISDNMSSLGQNNNNLDGLNLNQIGPGSIYNGFEKVLQSTQTEASQTTAENFQVAEEVGNSDLTPSTIASNPAEGADATVSVPMNSIDQPSQDEKIVQQVPDNVVTAQTYFDVDENGQIKLNQIHMG